MQVSRPKPSAAAVPGAGDGGRLHGTHLPWGRHRCGNLHVNTSATPVHTDADTRVRDSVCGIHAHACIQWCQMQPATGGTEVAESSAEMKTPPGVTRATDKR